MGIQVHGAEGSKVYVARERRERATEEIFGAVPEVG